MPHCSRIFTQLKPPVGALATHIRHRTGGHLSALRVPAQGTLPHKMAPRVHTRPMARAPKTDHAHLLGSVRAVLADEVHVFADGDRLFVDLIARPSSNSSARSASRSPWSRSVNIRPRPPIGRSPPREGDLIVGKQKGSAIGMLVERSTRFVMRIHLPADHTAVSVRDALQATVQALPPHLKRPLTWYQGSEMAANYEFTIATNVPVYFATRSAPANAAPARTRTAWCDSTSPRAATCPPTPAGMSTPSLSN